MTIDRLSRRALAKLLRGDVLEDGTCVIKFYSNNCHLCHGLQSTYEKLAEEYTDLHFFAFNVGDNPRISKTLNFQGVPTISLIKVSKGAKPQVKKMKEPARPDRKTWYTVEDIKSFIEEEK